MTLRARLPLLPPGAVEVSDNLGIWQDADEFVFFNAAGPIYSCARDDRLGVRHGAAMMLELDLAGPKALSAALGLDRTTLHRARERFKQGGVEELRERRRGPQGAHKLVGSRQARAQERLSQGWSARRTAEDVGVSPSTIVLALKDGRLTRPSETSEVAADEPTLSRPTQRAEQDQSSPVGVGVKRYGERFMARLGLLGEASPEFLSSEAVKGGGVLLALPALLDQGLVAVGESVYGQLSKGFFGLRSVLLTLTFMALLRIKTPEQLTSHAPGELGLLLGLDRAPEVKTLRRKLAELGERGLASTMAGELAQRWASAEPDALGYLYVDGHVRPYTGRKHALPKQHVQRRHQCMPGTKDFWVNDRKADPLLFVTAEATEGLLSTLETRLLPEIRELVGAEARPTLIFDREGWSPERFRKWYESEEWHVITYRKGEYAAWRESCFDEVEGIVDGRKVSYKLADRLVAFLPGRRIREVRRLCDDGHQTAIVTTDRETPAWEIAGRMFSRWRQENFFRYMRLEFDLDHLCTYAVEAADPERLVSHPEYTKLKRQLQNCEDKLGRRILKRARLDDRGKGARKAERLDAEIARLESESQRLRAAVAALSEPVPIKEVLPKEEIVKLERERKVLTDLFKMIAYRAETALAEMLVPLFKRHDDEARKFLKSAFQLPADIVPDTKRQRLTVRVHGMSNPRSTRALTDLCAALNQRNVTYPGTRLTLRFEVA